MSGVIIQHKGKETKEGFEESTGLTPIRKMIKQGPPPKKPREKEDEGDMHKAVEKRDEEIKRRETPTSDRGDKAPDLTYGAPKKKLKWDKPAPK
jgi:hypothetical protein